MFVVVVYSGCVFVRVVLVDLVILVLLIVCFGWLLDACWLWCICGFGISLRLGLLLLVCLVAIS